MRKIKKLIFKSYYRCVLPIVTIFGVIIAFFAIVIDYENINSYENKEVFMFIGVLFFILILCILIMYIAKNRFYTKLSKYIEENSLSYDSEFEKITKHIFVSKDILIDTYYSSKCAIHTKMIDSYKRSVINVGARFYPAIVFTLKDGLKEQICTCPSEADYETVLQYLNDKNITSPIKEESETSDVSNIKNKIHQPKSALATIAIIIVISLIFGGGYYLIKGVNVDQHYSIGDETLEVVSLSEDLIGVTASYYEDEEVVYIYNNSPTLLAVDMMFTNGDKFEDTGKIYIRPFGAYMHFVSDAEDVDEYKINDYTFYRSTDKASMEYAAYISENYDDHLDIALNNDDMNEENVKEILNEEKDYISYDYYQTLYYHFYDMDPELLISEYPTDGSHTYMGIIDETNKSIEIYKNVDGVDTIIETIKY